MLRRSRLAAVCAAALLLAAGLVWANQSEGDRDGSESGSDSAAGRLANAERDFQSNDPIERACELDREMLRRIWRGHDPDHSEDVTIVPLAPNYSGSFGVTSHSGPWDYLQRVPLVFYGPDHIKPRGHLEREASITDVYSTAGALTQAPLEPRAGAVRNSILRSGAPPPKLVVTIMWDGVGRNVLERWPEAWPNLARLEREGASFVNATVGSSPSITPAVHSTIGTGAFPRDHGVTAIEFRSDDGRVSTAFAKRDPKDLKLSTFADQIDLHYDNASLVGMLGWRSWHMGMMSHGAQSPGGDADHLGIIGFTEQITGNSPLYSTPDYLDGFEGLDERIQQLDREDGEVDGQWMGRGIAEKHDNPAWVAYQTDAILALLRNEGYGSDDIPDFFFTNYKMTDIVGHQYTMDSDEMPAVLAAQDEALGRLIDYLDEDVDGDYVVILSSDHGHTPSTERSGAWPLLQGKLSEHVDEHFGIEGRSLIQQTTAVGPFLNLEVMEASGITAPDVAEFLNSYTVRDNWGSDDLPGGYEERGDENVLAAAFAAEQLDDVMNCAFEGEPPTR